MATVVWRDWFNEKAVKQLEAMGTLPRNEIEIDDFDAEDGCLVARLIAKQAFEADSENFREGGEIVIIEPAAIAGTYGIETDWEPRFYAAKSDLK